MEGVVPVIKTALEYATAYLKKKKYFSELM